MPTQRQPPMIPFARRCRTVASALIAALWPGKDGAEVEVEITEMPPRGQVMLVAGVLGLLFLVCLFAAQFGVVGLAIFFAAVIVVMR